MNKNNDFNFQYNSCISKGICSVSPRTSALQNVLVFYLNICAKYCLNLYNPENIDTNIKDFVLDTVVMCVSNPEFNETCFLNTLSEMHSILKKLNAAPPKQNKELQIPDISAIKDNLTEALKFGEEISKRASLKLSNQVRDLYKILLLIAKSICINILDSDSLKINNNKHFFDVLKILNNITLEEKDYSNLIKIAKETAKTDIDIMHNLHSAQENRYGIQGISNVSYTTTPSKAVLVVGSNIRELETILNALSETDIDVYTHDEMMVAHTFPRFKTYQKLKGQYGYGLENCLIDFATFPGPIILTKHSLHNIENFYRGLLFSTEKISYKGVIRIKDDDFSGVINAANEAKGFKTGRICENVNIGYDFEQIKKEISEKLTANNYRKIIIIGLNEYNDESKKYFEELLNNIDKNTLIISFSYKKEGDNFICINACFDSYAVIRIYEFIKDYKIKKYVFMPKCNKKTFSEIIYLKSYTDTSVYIGNCIPIMINPTLKKTLESCFEIKTISSPKSDIDYS